MPDLTPAPTSARNLASLAVEILDQLAALVASIRHLHGDPGFDSDVKNLADLAHMHATEWSDRFNEEVRLHDATDQQKRGDA